MEKKKKRSNEVFFRRRDIQIYHKSFIETYFFCIYASCKCHIFGQVTNEKNMGIFDSKQI